MKQQISVEEFMSLAGKPRTVQSCNADFTLSVQAVETVQDCANLSSAEVQSMMNGLIRAWHTIADPMCSNSNCPAATITNFQQTSTQCVKDSTGNNVWTLTANITGQCQKV